MGGGRKSGGTLPALTLAALGVVYGDIGTSPLYALREAFNGDFATELNHANVLGVLSLMIWSLVLVISIKYMAVVMRADRDGEGGILALMVVARDAAKGGAKWIVPIGIFGAALLYGDGMITPAISVLSAVEGLEVATHVFEPYVVPITIAILVGLFLLQSRGTSGIGALFGPVMLLWFTVLGVLGVGGIASNPAVLAAFDPSHAVAYFARNGIGGAIVLGAVFLVVTGGEALYADMGHLGPKPIRIGWFALVLPGLLLNYLGQGAMLLADPEAASAPFYLLAPEWALYPLTILATFATIIASQAVISGTFSLTLQAVHFGFLPRVRIRHTSKSRFGQIYVPSVNWVLLAATVGLVLAFQRSHALAAAYGVAVTVTMLITDVLLARVMHRAWRWPIVAVIAVTVVFMALDVSYFGANALKILEGAWFPLVVAAIVYVMMSTWRLGRRALEQRMSEQLVPSAEFLAQAGLTSEVEGDGDSDGVGADGFVHAERTPGGVVYLTSSQDGVPRALLENFRLNRVLHEQVVFLTVISDHAVARRKERESVEVEELGKGFYRVIAQTGFMQQPNITGFLAIAREHGLDVDLDEVRFVLAEETVLPSKKDEAGLPIWRDKLFALMARNAQRADDYFELPRNRVTGLGPHVPM